MAQPAFTAIPPDHLKLVGLTGTKGKTTGSYLMKAVIEAAGHKAGYDRHRGLHDWRRNDSHQARPRRIRMEVQALLRQHGWIRARNTW